MCIELVHLWVGIIGLQGVCGILDGTDAIFCVRKTHFENMYSFVEIARFLYTGVQHRSATRTTETETQSFFKKEK